MYIDDFVVVYNTDIYVYALSLIKRLYQLIYET